MAATNFTPISLYYSTTASAVPTAANLVPGELAINTNNGKLYYEDSSGVVRVLASKSTGTIGGSTTQVQYNSSGSLAGSANFIFNGTNVGIGVTPNANEFGNILQINQTILNDDNGGTNHLSKNAYYSSGWKYISTDFASKYTQASGTHQWSTAPSGTAGNTISFTQAMTLDASGNLLVGTTSQLQSSRFSVLGTGNIGDFRTSSASGYPVVCENTASGSTNMVIFLSGASTTTVGSITYNGSLTLYNTTSDQRLKTNIVNAPSALSKINSIQIRSFDWKETGNHIDFGVIAQELKQVAPETVTQGEDKEDGSIKRAWAVDTSVLVPAMIKAIQEQQALIESLTTRLTALESK